MGVKQLTALFDLNHMALHLNAKDMTHEDSLVQPQPAGNCFNWVVGHLVVHRSDVLEMLGEPRLWSGAEGAPYARGSEGIHDPAAARRLEDLLAAFDAHQAAVHAALGRLGQERFDTPDEKDARRRTLGEQLHFMQFHEAYHIGQLGLLRRMAGRPGAIR